MQECLGSYQFLPIVNRKGLYIHYQNPPTPKTEKPPSSILILKTSTWPNSQPGRASTLPPVIHHPLTPPQTTLPAPPLLYLVAVLHPDRNLVPRRRLSDRIPADVRGASQRSVSGDQLPWDQEETWYCPSRRYHCTFKARDCRVIQPD